MDDSSTHNLVPFLFCPAVVVLHGVTLFDGIYVSQLLVQGNLHQVMLWHTGQPLFLYNGTGSDRRAPPSGPRPFIPSNSASVPCTPRMEYDVGSGEAN